MICLLFITLPSFATAQTQVCGLNYGQDETWINQTFDQNSLLTYTTLDIEVAGTIRVIDGATLSITTCTLHIADDARLIKTGKINNKYQNKININDIESGVYFIKIFNNSEVIYNNKLIKN